MSVISKVDVAKNSNDLGIIVKKSNIVVLDEPFFEEGDSTPEASILIHVGTGAPDNTGVIVWENSDGQQQVITGAGTGLLLPIQARRILTSATFGGAPILTTATGLTWLGAQ